MRRTKGTSSLSTIHWCRLTVVALALFLLGCGGGSSSTLTSVQRQIAMLPCPPGVSEQLWDTLTSEMLSQLEKRASAQPLVAGPPLDELSIVDDLSATEPTHGTLRLRWSYRNTGDYDQNSETNISDLTPIGRHFNKTPASADWGTASVADGDLNREVNISDITPIGRCYLQTVTEYRIEYNPSGGPGSQFEHRATADFSEGAENANGWLSFDKSLGTAQSGYYRVVPYYHAERGIAGSPVYFGANQPPDAVLTADPQAGGTPLVVNFDASESHDPENLALTYEWDWEGDGVWDYTSSNPVQQREYTEEGEYAPMVKVKDNKSAEATDQLMVYAHDWEYYQWLDNGDLPNLTMINGKPAFSYAGRDAEVTQEWGICYACSLVEVPQSTSDWQTITVVVPEEIGDTGIYTSYSPYSCFELDGRPAIIYYAYSPFLSYFLAHATSETPTDHLDWEISKIWAGSGMHGFGTKTVVVDNHVYCVACPPGDMELVLMRSLVEDPQGPEDWDVTVITDTGTSNPEKIDNAYLAYLNGRLFVSSTKLDGLLPFVASCPSLTPQGPVDWQVSYVDTGQQAGGASIIDVAGIPFVQLASFDPGGTRSFHLARGLLGNPQSPVDWDRRLVLHRTGGSYEGWLTDFRGGRLAFSADEVGAEGRQVLALYPAAPGEAGFEQPWVAQPVNPGGTDYANLVQAVYSGDWMMCLWVDRSPEFGSPAQMYFATALSPVKH